MTTNITNYTGLKSAVQAWMARSGDTLLEERFDDFLALHEQRMYYGAREVVGLLPHFEPLRIRAMEITDPSFSLTGAAASDSARITQDDDIRVIESAEEVDETLTATVAQPAGFLQLIEASLNSPYAPLRIEHEGVIAAYGDQTLSSAKIIVISGRNFRFKEASGTATLRYFQKLTTPSASGGNWILENAPGVYLNGCLIEAALMTSDFDGAMKYGAIYAAQVAGLNGQRRTELSFATNVRMRVRGRTP